MEHIKTLQQAIQYFGDPENCRQFMVFMRWPDGVPACPYCGATKLTWLAKANVYRCYGDHKKQKFSLKVGTVFEDSPIGLDKWLPAIWLLCNAKNGISSYELHRALGVTQKTAWFMLHRIRLAMESETFHKLGGRGGGPVEIDEAFIGPKPQRMHADRRAKMKLASGGKVGIAVMRMLDRELRQVRAKVIPNVKRDLLVSLCEENETQLIATTHSYEFLKAIAPSLEDSRTARNFQL
jgi:transposase-like protein